MNDELDPKLLALFEAARETPLDDGFVDQLMAQVDRQRRRMLLTWTVAAAVIVAIVATLTPSVLATLEMTSQLLPSSLINIETDWLQQLLSPVNSVAAAMAVGLLLVRRFWRGIFG